MIFPAFTLPEIMVGDGFRETNAAADHVRVSILVVAAFRSFLLPVFGGRGQQDLEEVQTHSRNHSDFPRAEARAD